MDEKKLKIAYYLVIGLLALMIIFTPSYITQDTSFLAEQLFEEAILLLLVALGISINIFYRKKLLRQEKVMNTAWKRVGKANIFSERLKTFLSGMDTVPENKNDLKGLLEESANKVLGLGNYEYVYFRIIDTQTLNTISELYVCRADDKCPENLKIGNRELIGLRIDTHIDHVVSTIENVTVQTHCLIPKRSDNDDKDIYLQKIVNDITLLYLVSESKQYLGSE